MLRLQGGQGSLPLLARFPQLLADVFVPLPRQVVHLPVQVGGQGGQLASQCQRGGLGAAEQPVLNIAMSPLYQGQVLAGGPAAIRPVRPDVAVTVVEPWDRRSGRRW